MKPLGILHLYRIRLRARVVQEALAVIGIAVGVGLLFASQVANTSLNGSVRQLSSGLVGQSRLQISARDPHGFRDGLFRQVQSVPGVRSAAPVLEAQANVIGPSGMRSVDLIGADPSFVRLGGALLRHFSAAALARQHAFALPAPIAAEIGASSLQVVQLQIGTRTIPVLLGLTLQTRDIGALVHSPVALAPLAYVQKIAGMPHRITRIFVQPEPGRDSSVRAALVGLARGRLNVEPADYDATLFANAATPTNESTQLFAVISALVGFLFAFNAILLTVPARRALIADLRLDGYGPWTVIEVLLFDALVLGIVASVLGLVLGDEISLRLFRASPGYLSFAFPVGSQRIVTWQSVVIAVGGGMLAAGIGVLTPLRDIVSPRPRVAIERRGSTRSGPNVNLLAGVACLAVTTGILAFAPQSAVIGVITLTGALLFLLPRVIRVVLGLVERLTLDIKATAPFIAVNELRSQATWTRTVAIAATGAIAVFGTVAIDGTRRDLERGLDASARGIDSMASIWVTPAGESDSFATTPFKDVGTSTLARLPGVQAAIGYRGGFIDYNGRRVWVVAPSSSIMRPIAATELVDGHLSLVTKRIREHGWVLLSKALATQHHLRVGQRFVLPSPRPTAFRVAGLITNLGWPSGAMVLNAGDYAKAWGSSDVTAYQVMLSPTIAPRVALSEVRRALSQSSGLVAETSSQRELRHYAEASQGLSRLTSIRTLVLIASILAMAAAMGSMIWQRRPRLSRLKLDGLSDLAVWRALLLESALLLGAGCSIGAIFGLYGQLLGSRAILDVTGFPVIFSLGVVIAASSFLLVSTVAVLISAIPGYFIARVRPAVGLSD
jgi:putative ABC transport system permease protein